MSIKLLLHEYLTSVIYCTKLKETSKLFKQVLRNLIYKSVLSATKFLCKFSVSVMNSQYIQRKYAKFNLFSKLYPFCDKMRLKHSVPLQFYFLSCQAHNTVESPYNLVFIYGASRLCAIFYNVKLA